MTEQLPQPVVVSKPRMAVVFASVVVATAALTVATIAVVEPFGDGGTTAVSPVIDDDGSDPGGDAAPADSSDGDSGDEGDDASDDPTADGGSHDGSGSDDEGSPTVDGMDLSSFPDGEVTDPEAHGFPGPSTTGVTDEDALEDHDGRVNVHEDGEVVEDLHIDGRIYVTADDVTIRNVRIDARNEYGIHLDGAAGVVIEDVEIVGQGESCIAGIAHHGYTARRVEVTNCDDGMRIGGDTTVEDSYIHGLRKSTGDEHNDALQTTGGSDIVIRNNTLLSVWQRQTSSVFLQAIFGEIDDVIVESNLLSGGSFVVYVEGVDEVPGPTDVTIRDNVVVQDSWSYGVLSTSNDPDILWEDNVSTTGDVLEP